MGSLLTCCSTCYCPRSVDDANGRRKILNDNDLFVKNTPDSTIKITPKYIETEDGSLIFSKFYEPRNAEDAKAMICFALGFGDHSEWFMHDRAIEYAEKGFVCFLIDWTGHGRSDGKFIHIQDFDADIVDKGIWAYEYAKNAYIKNHNVYKHSIDAQNNYFLFGASMGGAIAIKAALKSSLSSIKWKGVVAICPMIGIKKEAQPPACAVWCMVNCCMPCCPKAKVIPNSVNLETLTEDLEIRKYLQSNPLRFEQRVSMITGYNLLRATTSIEENVKKMDVPIWIGHGDADKITDCLQSKEFYQNCGCKESDKELCIYKGCGHALFGEEESVIPDTIKWMMNRVNLTTRDDEHNDGGNVNNLVEEEVDATTSLV